MPLPPGAKLTWKYDFSDVYNSYVNADQNRGPRYELVPAGGKCPEDKRGAPDKAIMCGTNYFIELGRRGMLMGEAEKEFRRIAGFTK